MNNRLSNLVVCSAILLCAPVFASMPEGRQGYSTMHHVQHSMNQRQHALYDAMRKLWEDHITWTRLYIVSAAHDLPNTDATTARLLKNQVDIGNAIKPFYGDAAGDKLSELLKDHILIAAALVTDAKAKNDAKVAHDKARWFTNADQIADFLAAANPHNWSVADMRRMMHDHLDLTLKEAVAELQGDYVGSVNDYDQVHTEILAMADMLSDGILNQFPRKLR